MPEPPVSRSPGWVRRRPAIELLGRPAELGARVTIALALVAIVFVGSWNAQHYPVELGYDAQDNLGYGNFLRTYHRLPSLTSGGEASQPPAYYVLASLAASAGHTVFAWRNTSAWRGTQYFNVLLVLLTALCVLWLARTVAPDRPWAGAAGVGFIAFLPVVAKTAAMFHPDNLNMLAGAAAAASVTHMLHRRDFRWRIVILVVASLALGLMTRQAAVFTFTAVLLGIAVALALDPELRKPVPVRRLAAAAAAMLALGTPWFVHEIRAYHDPFGPTRILTQAFHPRAAGNVSDRGDIFGVSNADLSAVFRRPWNANFVNRAFPETYTEIWGDYYGHFAWSDYAVCCRVQTVSVLQDQSYIGIVPTALAVAGWCALLWFAARRKHTLLPAALLPLVAIAGYLYRSYLLATPTDYFHLFKATYLLNTAPVFALGFGLGAAWLGGRSRLVGIGLLAVFVIFAVLELRFMMYGLRDHRQIF